MQIFRLVALALAGLATFVLGGSAAQAGSLSVLHVFTGTPDGAEPDAALINVGGTLYGTTREGGTGNAGAVFTISPTGAESVLYSFEYSPDNGVYSPKGSVDGEFPIASLIDVGGILYGTTTGGGDNGCGTVFQLTPGGVETVLYAFKCNAKDGAIPRASLINVDGTLYGTTYEGGANGFGTVFKVTLSGKETVLHSFGATGDGMFPLAALINVDGTLYGTTYEGGANSFGTVFTISPAGEEKVLYSFQAGNDANYPWAPLLNVDGTLYGTSEQGGKNVCENGKKGCGTVFTITPSGNEAVLYSFKGELYGMHPVAGLINVNGTLYGTTEGKGSLTRCGDMRCGTIFKLTPGGTETILHSLSPDDGAAPTAGLVKVGHSLYGTASSGGDYGHGTVFALEHH